MPSSETTRLGLPDGLSRDELIDRTTYVATRTSRERAGRSAISGFVTTTVDHGVEFSYGRAITPSDLDEYGHVPSTN